MNRVRRKRQNKSLYKYTIMVHVVIIMLLMLSVLLVQHKPVVEDRSDACVGTAIVSRVVQTMIKPMFSTILQSSKRLNRLYRSQRVM